MGRLVLFLVVLLFTIVTLFGKETPGHECQAERWFRIMDTILKNQKHHVYSKRQVAFFARFRKDFSMSSNSGPLVFDDVITNVGNGYSKHTGVFTCPVRGIYHFQWTMLPYHKNTFHSELVLNGKVIIFNYANAQTSSRTTSSMATLSLTKGDKVWIRKHGSNLGTTNGETSAAFQGFKL